MTLPAFDRTAMSLGILLATCSSAAPAFAQCIKHHQTLPPSGPVTDHRFGEAVAIDSAGVVLAVGAPVQSAAVYLFERAGADWRESAVLTSPSVEPFDGYAGSVALSGDGQTLIVGASWHGQGTSVDTGAAYVYARSAGSWTLEATLLASDSEPSDRFGVAVALSDDGDTALVGAPFDDGAVVGTDVGSAYAFVRSGGVWTQQAKLRAAQLCNQGAFGTAVALGADGDVAFVGSPNDVCADVGGSAHAFRRTGGVWGPAVQLPHAGADAGEQFGCAVATSDDGSLAFVGARDHESPLYPSGVVFVIAFDGVAWTQVGALFDLTGVEGDRFGDALSVTADGSTAWVAAPEADRSFSNLGAVFVFDRVGSQWLRRAAVQHPDAQGGSRFGEVGLDADGSTAVIGAPWHDTTSFNAGLVYTFEDGAPAISHYCTAKTNSIGCVPVLTTRGTPSASAGSGFALEVSNVLNNKSGLFFYSTTASQGVAFQGGWLCAKPPIRRTPATSSGGNPPPDDCSGSLAIDFNEYIASGVDPALTIEANVWGQFWSRDPGFAPPNGTSLTHAVHFVICY